VIPSTKQSVEKLEVLKDPAFMTDTTTGKVSMGYAHGLLYAFNSLYVMINHRGNAKLKRTSRALPPPGYRWRRSV